MYIYKITNTVNGKCYIGQTRCRRSSDRIRKHQLELRKGIHANEHLQRSWTKYGSDSFTFEVIARAYDLTELDLLEIAWISELRSMNPEFGYNKESGGNRQKIMSKETRSKISKALTGRPVSDETRVKISESNKIGRRGIFHSEETRRKMSESHKAIAKRGSAHHAFGKTTSDKQKQAVREANARKSRKKIMCVETGEIFDCTLSASKALNIRRCNITAVLIGIRPHTHRLTFRYL